MLEDKVMRASLGASLFLNGLAVCLLGYSSLLKPARNEVAAAQEKAKPTRLIEIQMLKDEKASTSSAAEKSAAKANDDGQDSDDSSDSGEGTDTEAGKSGGTASSRAHRASMLAAAKSKAARKSRSSAQRERAKGKRQGKPNFTLNSKPNLAADLGTIHLKKPEGRVVGGFHGVLDLRNVKIKGKLVADVDPKSLKDQKPLPNKYIGQSHLQVFGKTSNTAVCVLSIGGNTIYASDGKIFLGPGMMLSGTKFCAPGLPGIPGSGGSQSNSGHNSGGSSLANSGQGSSRSSGGGNGKDEYQGENVATKAQSEEKSGASGKGGRGGSGYGGNGSSEPTYDAKGGSRKGGSGSGSVGDDDSGAGAQEGLQSRYERMAKGPLRDLDDVHGGFVDSSNGAPVIEGSVRALHLPATHEDPTDRVVDTRSGVSGNSRTNRSGQKGGTGRSGVSKPSQYVETAFAYAPQSVGSHSTRGTVPWAPDSSKKPKHKRLYGLLGEYYTGMEFEHKVMERRDPKVDFTWTGVSVDPRIPMNEPYSVRWTGKVVPRYSETYTFYTASDDGVRLWVDGKLLVNDWTTHAPSEDTGQLTLTAGQSYSVRIDYFENGYGEAAMKFYWESPSQVKEYVPEKCLVYPSAP
jgi:hypothetical protein